MAMKISIISTDALPTPPIDMSYGGIEVECWWLARGLAERGHSVTLLAKVGSMTPMNGRLIEVHDEHTAYRHIEGMDFDAVIDFSHDKAMSVAHPEWPQVNCHQVMSLMGSGVNPVLISHGQHDTKMPSVKCEIVYQHIDLNLYKPNYGERQPYFLTMAQIIEEKRIDWSIRVALEAGVPLKVRGPWWGDSRYMDMLREMAQGHPEIDLGDSVGGQEKLDLLRNARGLLHFPGAKDFCEAGSIITLEALASGTPVVLSDNGVHREYVKNGLNGWMVNSIEDAVLIVKSGLVGDIDKHECRKSVEWAGYQAMAQEYEVLCQRVASGERWNV